MSKFTITTNKSGNLVYKKEGFDFEIELFRYTDPFRENLADSAALYLGKPDTDNIKRPLNILKMGHALEIFRGESATFKFKNVPKQVYDHLITYKTMQMRVAGGNRALVSDSYTLPTDKMKDQKTVQSCLDRAMKEYNYLAETETPQVARSIMPVNANMHPFKLQFNFQTLIESLFVQRIWEKGAQGLTVEVVKGMFELCKTVDSELWKTIYEYYGPHIKEWKEVRNRIKDKISVGDFLNEVCDDGYYYYFDDDQWEHEETHYLPKVEYLNRNLEEVLRELYGQQKPMW